MKYKVIIRDPESGTEKYLDDLTKADAIQKAALEAANKDRKIYIEWQKPDGSTGYLNRNGDSNCPGEPW